MSFMLLSHVLASLCLYISSKAMYSYIPNPCGTPSIFFASFFQVVSPCHTCFSKETKCKPICMIGSSFMHIVTYKSIQKQYHVRKRKIIRVLRLNPGNEGTKLHKHSTGGCVRLELHNIFTSSSCSNFLSLRNIVYSKGKHLSGWASVRKEWMQRLYSGLGSRHLTF
jgi:predicted membrane metal-binding protein